MTPSVDGSAQRWYAHRYNRPDLYRPRGALSWVPRRLRLALARHIGRLAPRRMPAERAAIRKAMARFTGATGSRLDTLTVRVFTRFRDVLQRPGLDQPGADRGARISHRRQREGVERLASLTGGLISLTAHVGNWELAGRLLAGRVPGRRTWSSLRTKRRELQRWVRRDGEGVRFVSRSRPTVSLELVAALRRGEVVGVQATGRSAPGATSRFRSSGTRRDSRSGRSCCPARSSPALAGLLPAGLAVSVRGEDRRAVHRRRGEEEAAARTWVAALGGRSCGEYPTQWFNFFDIWDPFNGYVLPPS